MVSFADYASSVLYNGLGRHERRRATLARRAFERDELGYGPYVVPELAEAASRTGDEALVRAALRWLSERTRAAPTEWALGIEARVRALLSEGDAAERLYRESIAHLGRTRVRVAARPRPSALRRVAAPRSAAASTPASSCAPPTTCWTRWASRRSPSGPGASCGPPARPPASAPSRPGDELTAQEAVIARLARDGLSNPEIGSRLFISAAHGPVPPAQGLRQARHQLAQPARPGPAQRPGNHQAGVAAEPAWSARRQAAGQSRWPLADANAPRREPHLAGRRRHSSSHPKSEPHSGHRADRRSRRQRRSS